MLPVIFLVTTPPVLSKQLQLSIKICDSVMCVIQAQKVTEDKQSCILSRCAQIQVDRALHWVVTVFLLSFGYHKVVLNFSS